jgi:preprotein translocase subunit SecE
MQFILSNLSKIILATAAIALVVVIVKYYVKIKTFLLEVKTELSKVSWSGRQELIGSTVVVIVITSIMAFFIGIIDFFLSKGLTLVFK